MTVKRTLIDVVKTYVVSSEVVNGLVGCEIRDKLSLGVGCLVKEPNLVYEKTIQKEEVKTILTKRLILITSIKKVKHAIKQPYITPKTAEETNLGGKAVICNKIRIVIKT